MEKSRRGVLAYTLHTIFWQGGVPSAQPMAGRERILDVLSVLPQGTGRIV